MNKVHHKYRRIFYVFIMIFLFTFIYSFFPNDAFDDQDPYKRLKIITLFDRLYYSTVIQTTLGFGNILPSDNRLRVFTMIQALSTILIILV